MVSLLAIVFLVFRGVLGHEFVHYDDSLNIIDNPGVSGLAWENIRWMLTDTSYAPRYMPLGWLCYAIDRQFFGLNPRIWHAGNLLVHALNTLLLFLVLKDLISLAARKRDSVQRERISNWCGAIGALCWAVNPLRVETVAWASARIYGVAVLFALIWILAWLRAQSARNERERRRYEWLALAAYAVSLLTYPLAVFAPVVLLALDVFPLRRAPERISGWWQRAHWNLWQDKIPFFLVSAVVLAVSVVARVGVDPRFRSPTLEEFGAVDRVMQACYVLAYFVWKPWAPFSLAGAYPTLHAFNPLDWKFVASALVVAAASAGSLALYKRRPAWLAVWICHGFILLPVLGLSEYPHSAFDRYSHLHGVLWSVVIATVLYVLWESERKKARYATLVATCGMWAILSISQIPAWKNSISLYGSIVARFGEHPGRGRFDEALGVFHLGAGETNRAIVSFENAIHYDLLRPDRHIYVERVIRRCEQRLADICASRGDIAGAAAHLETALKDEHDPAYMVPLTLKFKATLARLSRESEALPWLRKAVETVPDDAALHRELGNVLQKLGHEAESRRHFEEERRLRAAAEERTHRS
jgi:protein O-mannosyl-transferase